ncbi:MAG TPA: N-acetylneuraminate synthase family protein [Patescibacteria group bacterium]|nr:N-acetylneuraminate synthase family protein [Patescibacteria group bacterium]
MGETLFVAEVSSNHHADLDRCRQFIDVAADIGCRAVKFQLFKIKELFAPQILQRSALHRERQQWELPVNFLPELVRRCREKNVQFGCTPFYLDAVDELEPHVDFYKIASYELLWDDLLRRCAATGKPIVLSTGMADLTETRHAVAVLREAGCCRLTLLHCASVYPVRSNQCNLQVLETLRRNFDCPVGWSDHSACPDVIFRAVHRWQADMIEFHLDLDGQGAEYSFGHCWLPPAIRHVITSVNNGIDADGDACKRPSAAERKEREWRADPIDGLRPLLPIRDSWKG